MICGLWEYGAGETEGVDAMLASLPGREADAHGRCAKPPVDFGWRGRVFTEAEKAERLPRFDAACGLAVTGSARLDGRAALGRTLGLPDPEGLPDTALILKSYARWSQACPERLLGDYAFALWDAHREVLFCARDHAGARPFYYAHTGERFVFASDLDAVLAAPGVSDELDEAAVATQLTYGARPLGERTCYRAVRRLLPGHALAVQRGAVRVRRWWRPEEVPQATEATDDAIAEECLALLSEAVRDRVRDRRSVGVHLSGGLDSSAVAVLAARELRRRGRPAPPAFAWHPPPDPDPLAAPEYGRIDAVRRQEDLQVFYRPPEARDVVAVLRGDGTRRYGDGHTLINEDVVQRAAAGQEVDVLLSGWGGDEGISFNGRGHYPQLLQSGRIGELWRELRERSRRPLAALAKGAALPLVRRGAPRWARRLRRGRWPVRKNLTFIHPGFARRTRLVPKAPSARRIGVRAKQAHRLQHDHLSRRIEAWAASGARHGIEYRYPLLDRRVLEFALGLPPEQYLRGRWSRWVMRRALDPVLPPEVCWNPDKRDPARGEPLQDAVAEALPMVRRAIEDRPAPPSRARYLDLPRLLEHLDPEHWRAGGCRAAVPKALHFLDF